eukprot:10653012-Alexandrium_andersonii.AAC.1
MPRPIPKATAGSGGQDAPRQSLGARTVPAGAQVTSAIDCASRALPTPTRCGRGGRLPTCEWRL